MADCWACSCLSGLHCLLDTPNRRGAGGAEIVVLACGSRGDVQPYIALCSALQQRGHRVVMFVPRDGLAQCEKEKVEAVPVWGDTEENLSKVGGICDSDFWTGYHHRIFGTTAASDRDCNRQAHPQAAAPAAAESEQEEAAAQAARRLHDPLYKKYLKMHCAGIPMGAIRQAFANDTIFQPELDPTVLDEIEGPEAPLPLHPKPQPAPAPTSVSSMEASQPSAAASHAAPANPSATQAAVAAQPQTSSPQPPKSSNAIPPPKGKRKGKGPKAPPPPKGKGHPPPLRAAEKAFQGKALEEPGRADSPRPNVFAQELSKLAPDLIVYTPLAAADAMWAERVTGAPAVAVFLQEMSFLSAGNARRGDRPSILAVSPRIAPSTDEYTSTGYLILNRQPSLCDRATLCVRRFLAMGPAPVYIGWGSIYPRELSPMNMLRLALRALKTAGKRGVIVGGWAKLDKCAEELKQSAGKEEADDDAELATFAAQSALFASSLVHEWLFPLCSCTVHHGGAGTTAAALRSGRPTIITPIICDQHAWANVVEQLGVGVQMPFLPLVDAGSLAQAIATVTCNTRMQETAEKLGQALRKEDGNSETADLLHNYVQKCKK